MIKKPFKDYTVTADASLDVQAIRDEVLREIDTRRRLYDRWIGEGRCTWTEAHARMTALMGALMILNAPEFEATGEAAA